MEYIRQYMNLFNQIQNVLTYITLYDLKDCFCSLMPKKLFYENDNIVIKN